MTRSHDEVMVDQSGLLTWINPCLTGRNIIFINPGYAEPRKRNAARRSERTGGISRIPPVRTRPVYLRAGEAPMPERACGAHASGMLHRKGHWRKLASGHG
jgi:hypothetical protein